MVAVLAILTLSAYLVLTPFTTGHKGCVGVERFHYKDNLFKIAWEPGLWSLSDGDRQVCALVAQLGLETVYRELFQGFLADGWICPYDTPDNLFFLSIRNASGKNVTIKAMDIEYPEGVHMKWSERGFDCGRYNTPGDTASGCREQNVSEGEVATLKVEDVGRGTVDLKYGAVYRTKVKVTFDILNGPRNITETAICGGRVE